MAEWVSRFPHFLDTCESAFAELCSQPIPCTTDTLEWLWKRLRLGEKGAESEARNLEQVLQLACAANNVGAAVWAARRLQRADLTPHWNWDQCLECLLPLCYNHSRDTELLEWLCAPKTLGFGLGPLPQYHELCKLSAVDACAHGHIAAYDWLAAHAGLRLPEFDRLDVFLALGCCIDRGDVPAAASIRVRFAVSTEELCQVYHVIRGRQVHTRGLRWLLNEAGSALDDYYEAHIAREPKKKPV
eukprot:TRINITY_DN1366_c0_g3_i1.p2 TRINITY_DN1366_c0_g3~~TRINITY_DN1366_c0_g3_i1.p2  ORF type:complete len:244 (+),score=34.88 TRINITY_DN1366_c0_g3_i1:817-1548(+)